MQLNPQAQEFQVASNHGNSYLIDTIQTLHMPKADMITFDGDPLKFWPFIKAFDNNVGRLVNVDEHAKLARLMQFCKGCAFKVIESCTAMDYGGYERARSLLRERFGDRFAISAHG